MQVVTITFTKKIAFTKILPSVYGTELNN